ncbi:MAG: hypothetical protein AB9844_09310 [Clostridiaceae bacterium]
MNNLRDLIGINIILATGLNAEKRESIQELEAKIKSCPAQWRNQTLNFIDIAKNNMQERTKLIEFMEKLINENLYGDRNISQSEVDSVNKRLNELDEHDAKAVDMYIAIMDEGI